MMHILMAMLVSCISCTSNKEIITVKTGDTVVYMCGAIPTTPGYTYYSPGTGITAISDINILAITSYIKEIDGWSECVRNIP